MLNNLYKYRFQLFLVSQLIILFGALVFPIEIYDRLLAPILHLLSLGAGLLLLHKNKKIFWFVSVLLLTAIFSFGIDIIEEDNQQFFNTLKIGSYFIFQLVVTRELILQVWKSKIIEPNTIMGLISGYISLGFIGFFIFITSEIYHPGSFSFPDNGISMVENLMYFSYITLLTIGYGEILPETVLAQKAVVFIGLLGQMYLVILTSIVVGKYINQKNS